jgi:PAS domain S-box-containing protein
VASAKKGGRRPRATGRAGGRDAGGNRELSESALRREHDVVSQLVETSPVGITVVDRDGRVSFANARAQQILGLTKDQISQRRYNAPDWRITHYDGSPVPDSELPFRRVMNTGQPVSGVRHVIERPDGQRVLLSIDGAPLCDEAGHVLGVVAVIEDITQREQSEAALRASERLLQQSQAVARLGSYVLEVPTGRWRSSKVLDEIFGIDATYPHDVDAWTAILHPDVKSEMVRYFQDEVLGRKQRFDREYRIVRPCDGRERWVHGLGDLECDASGRVVCMLGTIQDITDR